MSWSRNQRDPFFATALSRMSPAGQRFARGIDGLIRRSRALSDLLWVGSGYRNSGGEHPTGRALDIIAGEVGQRARTANPAAHKAIERLINEVLVPNAKALGIRHIIWDNKIYRTRYNAWGPLPGQRSGVSDRHEDHAHVWLEPGAPGWLAALDRITLVDDSTSTSKPSAKPLPPATGADGPKKPKITKYRVVTRVLPLTGRSGPGKQYRKTMTAAKGYVLSIVETRNGWARSTGGHWYSMAYLKRV